ncbi:MAG: transglycosylase domain-containing protein [Myxococcota bacterium]
MSQETARESTETTAQRTGRWRLVVAVCLGLVALVLMGSYLARTQLVVGSLVDRRVSRLAERHGVDIQIATMNPDGLTGVVFEGVEVAIDRGEFTLEAKFDSVAVAPDIDYWLQHRRVVPRDVEVSGGVIDITRVPGRRAPPKDAPAPSPKDRPKDTPADRPTDTPKAAAESPKQRPTKPESAEPAPLPPTRAILRDISVSVRPEPLPGTTRALELQRAELQVRDTATELKLDSLRAYGALPDGIPFSIREVDRSDPSSPTEFVLEPESPTRIETWFDTDAPLEVAVERVRMCPNCDPTSVTFEQLNLWTYGPMGMRSPEATLEFGETIVRGDVPEMELYDIGGVHPPLRLEDFSVRYDRREDAAMLVGQFHDSEGGSLAGAAKWLRRSNRIVTLLELDQFSPQSILRTFGLADLVDRGRLDGRLKAEFDRKLSLMNTTAAIDVEDVEIKVPHLSSEPLTPVNAGLEFEVIADVDHRAISVPYAALHLGAAEPIYLDAYAIDAHPGWVLEAVVNAADLDPSAVNQSLPNQITRIVDGAEYEGTFGFRIATAVHTAYPKSLELDVSFDGDIEVIKDSVNADIRSLAAQGPPPASSPNGMLNRPALRNWVDYEELPEHVPTVLTAAEDAQFFSHNGFDWVGVRRAMSHNLEARRLERGGSTLSQQLTKNLFLSHDRTLARKLQEAYVTWRLERELPKERILELYVNIVAWGPNVRGLDRAAEYYFDTRATELTIGQMALLSAILPGPSLYGPKVKSGQIPSSRVEKIEHILANLSFLGHITYQDYLKLYGDAKKGRIGGLKLDVCRDDDTVPKDVELCWERDEQG